MVTKRERELFVLESCLSRLWGGRNTWGIISEQERPDFLVRDPQGTTLGVEVTELLTPDQGEARSLDGRLNTVTIEVITAWLAEVGEEGAFVIGDNADIPNRAEDLEPFRGALRKHLDIHGNAKLRRMRVPFRHQWGEIQVIAPWDLPEVHLTGNGWGPSLDYMKGRPQSEIEMELVEAVRKKVEQAAGYDRSWPLWLFVSNPNQGIEVVRPETRQAVRVLVGTAFQRVLFANLPMGTRDASPPYPYTIDLL